MNENVWEWTKGRERCYVIGTSRIAEHCHQEHEMDALRWRWSESWKKKRRSELEDWRRREGRKVEEEAEMHALIGWGKVFFPLTNENLLEVGKSEEGKEDFSLLLKFLKWNTLCTLKFFYDTSGLAGESLSYVAQAWIWICLYWYVKLGLRFGLVYVKLVSNSFVLSSISNKLSSILVLGGSESGNIQIR